MLDSAFVLAQRDRLLRRSQEYTSLDRLRSLPTVIAERKALIAARIIPLVLMRIQNGTYGTCLDCGEEIPRRRLELIPAALRCIHCQSVLEEQ